MRPHAVSFDARRALLPQIAAAGRLLGGLPDDEAEKEALWLAGRLGLEMRGNAQG